MPDRQGPKLPFRKRRRQAVVCTSCRRRKIACDRKAPCAQCVLAHLKCTYYQNYACIDSQIDSHNSASSQPYSSSSASTTQDTHQYYSPGPPSEALANANYLKNFSTTDLNVASAVPGAISVDMSGADWFETEVLGALDQPLSTAMDASAVTLFPDSVTAPQGAVLKVPAVRTSTLDNDSAQGLFDDVVSVLFRGEGHPLLQKCKTLAREVKSKGPDFRSPPMLLQEYMPPREVCDELVRLYLRTFESVFRVLHVPCFRHDYLRYWSDPQSASEPLVLQLLLVMAIGTCFYQDAVVTDGAATLRCQATHWIHACQVRLAAPFRKKHLSLRRVQSQCLLVIGLLTNTNAVGGDLAGISVASLVQSAMAVGLHIAPSQLPVSPLEAEVRRRLWVTILELAVQCSLDSGTHPVIPAEAMNCEFPSNLNDSQFSDSTETLPMGHATSTFTQSSIQSALLRSLPIRLRIAELLSRFQGELSYDTALRMGAELMAACRETSKLMNSFLLSPATANSPRPRAFHIKIQDLLFAHKATSNVAYHFSRTMCQESALLLLSPPSSQGGEPTRRRKPGAGDDGSDDDYNSDDAYTDTETNAAAAPWSSLQDFANLQLFGGGVFRDTFLAASLIVCAEILQQLREDSSPVASSLSRRELLHALEHATSLTRRRVRAGETSVKAAAFFACMHACISARRTLLQHALVVADTVRTALAECCAVLEARLHGPIGSGVVYVDGSATPSVERQLGDRGPSLDGSDPWDALSWEDDDVGFLHQGA
ncbi:hypothetical protein CTA1_11716 [Colletotrichum tanaceti]|uniref:Zn(2)-C6 fungal-type domain-containing protein n=1 Tax=Colletotrichum tanaceti TaxID=1306861 RepID=A0A4U6XKN7_9PEZI|nr:hypothetical protein CTA1_11716 [Colletotrichum tanaceti]